MRALDIIESPHIVFSYAPHVETFWLSGEDKRSMIAVVSNFIQMGVDDIGAIRRVGSVMSVEVEPYRNPDPTLLVCNKMNLYHYYRWWNAKLNHMSWREEAMLPPFTSVFNSAITTAKLSRDELMFAAREMLIFQNEMMKRG